VQTFSSLGFQTSFTIEEHLTIGISSTTHIKPPSSSSSDFEKSQHVCAASQIPHQWFLEVLRQEGGICSHNSHPGAYRNDPKFGPNSDPMSTETGQNLEQVRSYSRTEWPSRYRTPIQSKYRIRLRWVENLIVLAPRAQPLRSSTPSLSDVHRTGPTVGVQNDRSLEAESLRGRIGFWKHPFIHSSHVYKQLWLNSKHDLKFAHPSQQRRH